MSELSAGSVVGALSCLPGQPGSIPRWRISTEFFVVSYNTRPRYSVPSGRVLRDVVDERPSVGAEAPNKKDR